MAILKKRPVIKSADDFINATPELTLVNDEQTESQNTINESSQNVNNETLSYDEKKFLADTRKDQTISVKAKEILLIDEDGGEKLKRVTTYIVDSLNKQVKLLSVLSGRKEYQLWNEALSDLLEKYKKKGL
jgi:hypothetical protein